VQEAIDAALADLEEEGEVAVPNDLEAQIREKLDGSDKSWDRVLWDLVTDEDLDEEAVDG
jgi:hypothetical protein